LIIGGANLVKRLYYDFKLKLTYLIKGIRTRNEIHLGDIVFYEGKEWFVNNAIKSCGQCGERLYDLIENVPYDENKKREKISVGKSNIKKIKNWSNFKQGIFNVYDFNMTYWHDINLRKLLE
jgi:hypothetical protein